MEGAARVFAGDFQDATLCRGIPGSDLPRFVVTPSGVWCNLVFLTGVLTETSSYGSLTRCRLADPTGAFDLEFSSAGRSGISDQVQTIPVPSFLSVTGRASLIGGNGNWKPVVRGEAVRVVDRVVRDAWIARTASESLQNISRLAVALNGGDSDEKSLVVLDHYRHTPEKLLAILASVETAIAGLPAEHIPSAAEQPGARETVIAVIRELQGPRGVAVEEVIIQAGIRGIFSESARGIIEDLIREDECYQPQKGNIRML